MPDEKRIRDLYSYLKKSGSDAIGDANESEFVSELKDSNRVKDLYNYLKKSGSDAIGEASERDFLDELGYGDNQPVPQQQPQPSVAAQFTALQQNQKIQFSPDANIQKVGDKTFDSNQAQKLLTTINGEDVLQVTTDDGVAHGVVRKPDGTYDWYRGNIDVDRTANQIKGGNTDFMQQQQLLAQGKPLRGYTATDRGIDISQEQKIANEQQVEVENSAIKKAAEALVKSDKNADDIAFEKLTEEEKDKLGLRKFQESDYLEQEQEKGKVKTPQSTLNEYTFRNEAINEQTEALIYSSEVVVKGLQDKYGERFQQYLDFNTKEIPALEAELANAQKANDQAGYNNLIQEINLRKEEYQDIEQDPNFRMLGDFNRKIEANQNRIKGILAQDNFKVARDLTDMYYFQQKERDIKGRQAAKEYDKEWNEGGLMGKAMSVAQQAGIAVSNAPEILATSIAKAPQGVVAAVKIGSDLIGINDTGKVNQIDGWHNQIDNFMEQVDLKSDISSEFKNTNTYSIMQGLADLLPQMAIAELTGGIGGLAGKAVGFEAATASAGTRAGLEVARQGIANVGFMSNDMYEANLELLKDVDGLTDNEKAKAASKLAYMQAAAVGVAGSMVGGALGSALGKAGLLDGQIAKILGASGVSQNEIRAVFNKSANLLKDGALKEYVAATSKGIADLVQKNWGNNATDIIKGITKSGGMATTRSGVEETLEEFAFEPMFQYVAEKSYEAFGGDVNIRQLQTKRDKEEAESRKQSGRTEIDDYLSVFAVGALVNGFGQVKKNALDKQGIQNELVNQALLVAMKDMPEFQKQMAKYKESQLRELEPNSAAYNQKKDALDKIEQDIVERIDLIKNGGSVSKSKISTFDVASKMSGGTVDEELIGLFSQKADAEMEYQALKLSQGSADANKAKSKTEGQEPPKEGFAKLQEKKREEILAIDKQITELTEANSKTLASRYNNIKNWIKGNDSKTKDEIVNNEIAEINQKVEDKNLNIDDISDTEYAQNLTPDERNALQAEMEASPEKQKEVAEIVVAEKKQGLIDNQREIANQENLTSQDLTYNTQLRTPEGRKEKKDDSNNIAFRKDRDYAYATQAEVDALAENKSTKGLKFNKGVTKGTKQDFVIERTKDENGIERTRVFERTENGFEVVKDEIGDKALLNNNDRQNIENARFKNASIKAENKREEIIAKVGQGKRVLLPDEVEKELSKDKEYQRLVKEAQDLAPKSSFWGELANTVQGVKEMIMPNESKVKKAIDNELKKLKKNKEIKEVDCPPVAKKGIHTNFKTGGKWELVKDIKGLSHEMGGVDVKINE